jgi:2-oxo-4-hydroxy-4-carboxy--5-ureidoimidazoline (OHCU) decarboxylase
VAPTATAVGERIKANISNAVHAKSLTSSFAFVYGNKPFGQQKAYMLSASTSVDNPTRLLERNIEAIKKSKL